MPQTERLDPAIYDDWRRSARILERDAHGDKVLLLANGLILKLFRDKGGLLRRYWPLSQRFARHAGQLQARGIPTVDVRALYRLPEQHCSAVLYAPLPGEILRDMGNAGTLDTDLAAQTGAFMAELHRKGVLFRSLHLGNILRLPDGRLGLIDIADLGAWPWPLGLAQRERNFRHFFRYTDNRWALSPANAETLTAAYLATADLSPGRRIRLQQTLAQLLAHHRHSQCTRPH